MTSNNVMTSNNFNIKLIKSKCKAVFNDLFFKGGMLT